VVGLQVRNTLTLLRLSSMDSSAGVEVDVSSPASIARLASMANDHLGGVDVWINNAGYSGSFQVGFLLQAATQTHI